MQMGVHKNTIRLWEKEINEPRLSDITKLCEILYCTESELLNSLNDSQIKVTLSYNWEDFKKGKINMNKSELKLILGDNGELTAQ